MVYLHKSVFQSHGYLSSDKCHVDSRWVLKISGFVLHAFRKEDNKQQVNKPFHYSCSCVLLLILFDFDCMIKIGAINSALSLNICFNDIMHVVIWHIGYADLCRV